MLYEQRENFYLPTAEDLLDRSLLEEKLCIDRGQPIAAQAGCWSVMANSRQQYARNSATGAMVRVALAFRVLLVVAMILQGVPLCRATFAPYGANSSVTSMSFRIGHYNKSCPTAETIVANTLSNIFTTDFKAPAHLMRLFFHECFVTGCDGSLLVNSTSSNQAEKAGSPNLSVAGFNVIDAAKAALESACPGIVSCADIEALITRDAIGLLGGPYFKIPTGRLDTRAVTTAAQATNALPSPRDSAQTAAMAFSAQGFTIAEFVTLMGAHTVGAAFCQTFSYRLYNYQGTGKATTSMDPNLVATLKNICPNPNTTVFPDPAVALDQGTINVIDNSYFQELQKGHGILEVDQNIGMDQFTGAVVTAYAGNGTAAPTQSFTANFAAAIIKLGTLNVITGTPGGQGSIRRNCAILN